MSKYWMNKQDDMDAKNLLIEELKSCFKENIDNWIIKSNNPKVYDFQPLKPFSIRDLRIEPLNFQEIVNESLSEILDILLREPDADYFWYGYPENGPGKLTYSTPDHDVVPNDALRVDREKIKMFLRDIKINQILN
jgi:hypothetical protein